MSKVLISLSNLSAIGDAIREKTDTEDLIKLTDMPQAILDIETGGGGDLPDGEVMRF